MYDNGYIEIDPDQCGYTTFLGAAVPEVEGGNEGVGINNGGNNNANTVEERR